MNYTKRAAILCCTCYIVLLLISLIPPQKVFGVELRRANVLSDIFHFSADNIVEEVELELDTKEYEVDFTMVEEQIEEAHTIEPTIKDNFSWDLREAKTDDEVTEDESDIHPHFAPKILLPGVKITPIEEFDTVKISAMDRLYRKMLSGDSLVRVAVLGDSFIEADIVTCDLREALQNQYGGCGVGFAPADSPLTKYRRTIGTSSRGWNSYNVMQHRTTPEPHGSNYSVSGWVSAASNGAATTWTTKSTRANIDSCQCVRIHFRSPNDSQVEVIINGTERRTFEIEGAASLRQIEVMHPAIRKVTMQVLSGAASFTAYGAHFDGESGVTLDNDSVRSNNGQAMFWTSAAINSQVDKHIGGYDLVILQYGLNIMQSGVNNYTRYAAQVEKMIQYVKQCYPTAAVLVMGVSDRSMKINGSYKPMLEAERLIEYQREAAQAQHVNFWSTLDAMRAMGGMSYFVANNWAAKDFTHINFKGGEKIAYALVDALNAEAVVEHSKMVRKIDYTPLLDSATIARMQFEFVRAGLPPQKDLKAKN